MQRALLSLKTCTLGLLLASLALLGCEPSLQFSADDITTQAKNAVDVLPANTAMLGMMNVQDLKSNPNTDIFGSNDFLGGDAPAELMARMQDFIEVTGFDPQEDLTEVYVALQDVENDDNPNASIVAYASIDPSSMSTYVEDEAGNELEQRSYRGVTVYDTDDGPSFSFVNDDMMIAATSPALLDAMIDRLEGEGEALSSNTEMMDLVATASVGESAWFVGQRPEEFRIDAKGGSSDLEQTAVQIMSALEHVVVGITIESDGLNNQVFLFPNTNVAADDLGSLTRGMVAALKVQPDLEEEHLAYLDEIEVTSSDEFVRIGFYADNEMIDQIKR